MFWTVSSTLSLLTLDNKGSQENHAHERTLVSNKFVQTVKKAHAEQQQKSLMKGNHGNVLDQIFDLLIKLEERQSGQGLKFVSEYVTPVKEGSQRFESSG